MLRARAIRQQLQDALTALGGRSGRCISAESPLPLGSDKHDHQQQAWNLRRCLAKSCWQQAARLQPETRHFVTAVCLCWFFR